MSEQNTQLTDAQQHIFDTLQEMPFGFARTSNIAEVCGLTKKQTRDILRILQKKRMVIRAEGKTEAVWIASLIPSVQDALGERAGALMGLMYSGKATSSSQEELTKIRRAMYALTNPGKKPRMPYGSARGTILEGLEDGPKTSRDLWNWIMGVAPGFNRNTYRVTLASLKRDGIITHNDEKRYVKIS